MKYTHKRVGLFLGITICVLTSMVVVYAATFFVTNSSGFHCTGTGTLSGQSYTAEFSAEALMGTPVQPYEFYSSSIMIIFHSDDYGFFGSVSKYGNISVFISGTENSYELDFTLTSFSFQGNNLGVYDLYNQ